MLICLVCPLFIPWLITVDKLDTKNVNNDYNKHSSDAARGSGNDRLTLSVLTEKMYHFYTAPIVKFCCHSVTTCILRVNSSNLIFTFSIYHKKLQII